LELIYLCRSLQQLGRCSYGFVGWNAFTAAGPLQDLLWRRFTEPTNGILVGFYIRVRS
jgi:hypothetical protein